MRRKNIVIVEVDVYAVGVYVSESKEAKGFEFAPTDNELQMCFLLRFVRSVSTKTVVDAIVSALSGSGQEYETALLNFKNILTSSIGSNGLKAGDEIEFCFKDGEGSVGIAAKGVRGETVTNALLQRKLIDIYTGEKAVAPAVHKILAERYASKS